MGIFILKQGPYFFKNRVLGRSNRSRLDTGSVVESGRELHKLFPQKFAKIDEVPFLVTPIKLDNFQGRSEFIEPLTVIPTILTDKSLSPLTVVSFVWGDFGQQTWSVIDSAKEEAVSNLVYAKRLFSGIRKNYNGQVQFKLFVDEQNSNIVIEGVSTSIMKPPSWRGCLPKLWAFNKENGIEEGSRVICFDLDTVIVGRLERMFSWNGDFICRENEKKQGEPGGNMLGFVAGSMQDLWSLFTKNTEKFVLETSWPGCNRYGLGGSERMAYKRFHRPDNFWQRVYPGAMLHYTRQYVKADLDVQKRRLSKASVVVFTGPRCHDMAKDCQIRKIWESYDK